MTGPAYSESAALQKFLLWLREQKEVSTDLGGDKWLVWQLGMKAVYFADDEGERPCWDFSFDHSSCYPEQFKGKTFSVPLADKVFMQELGGGITAGG